MDKIENLIQKLEQIWPGELGDDVDVKEIQQNPKVLNELMPLLQGMQIQPMSGNGSDGRYYLIQIPVALQVEEKKFEIIKEFLLRNTGYERPVAEVVEKPLDKDEK